MRLIDADKLWLTTEYVDGKEHKYYEQFEVDNAPTIDAEPVRHGKWNRNNIVYMECSECGWLYEYYLGLEEEWNFCPHCGARMEENEE